MLTFYKVEGGSLTFCIVCLQVLCFQQVRAKNGGGSEGGSRAGVDPPTSPLVATFRWVGHFLGHVG